MIGEINPRFDGYGFSLTGHSHAKTEKPCQDSHLLDHTDGRWQLVAVADGVGSAPCSAEGSAAALSALAFRCAAFLDHEDDAEVMSALQDGFWCAMEKIHQLAMASGRPLQDYDTTLTACLFDGDTLLLGHVGDGGVIGMDAQCRYHLLTEVQKGDAWNEVCPLRFGEAHWVFQRVTQPYKALLLLTDGLLDHAVPSLLFGQEDPLYRRFISFFLPPDVIGSNSCPTLEKQLIAMLSQDAYGHLTDDLTAAAIWRRDCGKKLQPAPEDYLKEPDWNALRKARYEKLYPHLKRMEERCNVSEKPPGAGAASG